MKVPASEIKKYKDLYHDFDTGVALGYPMCCIVEHCKRCERITEARIEGKPYKKTMEAAKITDAQEKVHANTGFIPCDSCAKKLIAKKLPLSSLIKNRKEKIKFPNY